MKNEREQKIAERRADMPKVYRASYDRAVSGRSLRAAVNSFCIHCVMYQREEVRLCTSLSCPLWPYRPYQGSSKNSPEQPDFVPESKNSDSEGNEQGEGRL